VTANVPATVPAEAEDYAAAQAGKPPA